MNQAKTQTHTDGLSSQNLYETLGVSNDCKTEELLNAGAATPVGKLLKKMAKLPEVRFEKVLTVRRQICKGQYGIEERLDATIDRMLEDLLVEP